MPWQYIVVTTLHQAGVHSRRSNSRQCHVPFDSPDGEVEGQTQNKGFADATLVETRGEHDGWTDDKMTFPDDVSGIENVEDCWDNSNLSTLKY